MTTLEIISVNIWNILFALCNLLILFLVIKKFLFGRVQKVVEERKNSIDAEYAAASESRENAEKLETDMKEKLESADAEADKIVKKGEDMAQRSYDKIVADANARAARIIESACLQAEAEKEKAASEIKEEIAEVSVEIARKLLEKELSEEEHRRLIKDALKEMEESGDTDQ